MGISVWVQVVSSKALCKFPIIIIIITGYNYYYYYY